MDAIIKSANFKRASEDDENELGSKLSDKLDEIKEKGKLLFGDVKSSCQALIKAVCVESFPSREDHKGSDMAYTALESIKDSMEFGVEENNFKQTECYKMLFELVCACMNCGPAPAHIRMILAAEQYEEFPEFLQKLDVDHFKKLAAAFKRQYKAPTDKGGMNVSDYNDELSSLDSILRQLVEKEVEGEKQSILLDLYSHFVVEENRLTEPLSNTMHKFQEILHQGFPDDNIFGWITDPGLFKAQLKTVRTIVCHKSFPRSEKHCGDMADVIENMMKTILKTDLILELAGEVLSIVVDVCKRKNIKECKKIVSDGFEYLFCDFPDNKKKPNQPLFDIIIGPITEILEVCTYPTMLESFVRYGVETVVSITSTKPCGPALLRLAQALLKTGISDIITEARNFFSDAKMKKALDLANNQADVISIMKTICDVDFLVVDMESAEEEDKERAEAYEDFTDDFLDQVKNAKLLKIVMEPIVNFILVCWDKQSDLQNLLCAKCCDRDHLDLKTNRQLVNRLLRKFDALLKDETYVYPWVCPKADDIYSTVMECAIGAFKDGRELSDEDNTLFISILQEVCTRDFENDDTGYNTIFKNIYYEMLKLFELHRQSDTMENVVSLVPLLLKMIRRDDENVSCISSSCFSKISSSSPELLAPYVNDLLDCFIATHDSNLASTLHCVYPKNPEPVHKRFQEIFDFVKDIDTSVRICFYLIFSEAAKKKPELFTEAMIKVIVEENMDDVGRQNLSILILLAVSEAYPAKVEKYYEEIMKYSECDMAYYVLKILTQIANYNKKYAKRTIGTFMEIAMTHKVEATVTAALSGVRSLAGTHLEIIKTHRAAIEKLQNTTMSGYVKDACIGLIDLIEGRSLATVHGDVKQQQEEIDDLGERVDDTEVAVAGLANQVDKHEEDIGGLKRDVADVEEHVEEVEGDLGETKVKVEEIDNKTMTNAPAWSRDLTKIMNPKDDHDWRLLAQRLGYSPDDIRHWATQSDPCMSLLSEWYATHKTSEATHAILKELVEMDRMDGAVIVENAMKAVEGVVEDEAPEYETPPPIFLSYQWSHQNEVKMLHKHLLMAGYQCWLDIGQMGGGDKLFEKIDDGIRASKVVISCVTEKYSKSPNCKREVNLSVTLGKSMIPLLMEQMGWPPRGAMGPIFSEYLFIRFFQRDKEATKDERFWSTEKFQELLMQLSFLGIMPDPVKIEKMYKNWWTPVTEQIVVDKDRNKKGDGSSNVASADVKNQTKGPPPSVFISYQWGKQKQIIALYKRLMGLGYHCWMDIHQMGGGDSLYDEIDRGVRGSKVVLSCITQKYALSANCRREVSLADALKKPIVPLLLESTDWPPPGPMSMVFTQLLYIDFHSDPDIQTTWKGGSFDQLLGKLDGYALKAVGSKPEMVKNGEKAISKKGGNSVKAKGTVNAIALTTSTSQKPKTPNIIYQENEKTATNSPVIKSEPASDTKSPKPVPVAQSSPVTKPVTPSSVTKPVASRDEEPKSKSCNIL